MSIEIQIFRLLMSSLVGAYIGLERVKRKKSAGVSTFGIIGVTSCFVTLISVYGLSPNDEPFRLISTFITAIGYIAVGVVFTIGKDDGIKVSGLTTGAEILSVGTMGIAMALGMYIQILTVIILLKFNLFLGDFVKKKENILDEDFD